MEIRELKARDVKVLAKMLGKLKSSSVGDLFIVLDQKKSNPMEIGILLFKIIAADLTDDIYAWIADLVGKTTEEFDEMPVSTPVDIIKELAKRSEFQDFLGRVTTLAETPKSSPDATT